MSEESKAMDGVADKIGSLNNTLSWICFWLFWIMMNTCSGHTVIKAVDSVVVSECSVEDTEETK